MSPDDFLALAAQLSSQQNEAARRSAISRAYYGVYHIAKQFVESCDVKVNLSAEGHSTVSRCIQNSGEPKLILAGSKLDSLRSIRNKADYDLSTNHFITEKSGSVHLQIASNVAEQIRQAQSDIQPIRQKIRAYARMVSIPVLGDD